MSIRAVSWCCLLLLGACVVDPEAEGDRQGTYVGNPGRNLVRLAPSGEFELVEAYATELSVFWRDCEGGRVTSIENEDYNLLDGDALVVPGGRWCAVQVALQGELELALIIEEREEPVRIELGEEDLRLLWATTTIDVDDNTFVLEVGNPGWLDEDGVGVLLDEVEGDEPDLGRTAILYDDLDESGDLDEFERAREPVASSRNPVPPAYQEGGAEPADDTGVPDRSPVSGEGLGCHTGPTAPWTALWLLGLLGWLGRRQQ